MGREGASSLTFFKCGGWGLILESPERLPLFANPCGDSLRFSPHDSRR
jgi:hypothetical protein